MASLIPEQRSLRAQSAANTVHRDTGLRAAAWTKIAVILTVIAAVLNLATATLHALPASSSGTGIVVIYAPPRGCATPRPPRAP
jgi:hypothetical protein